MILLYQTVTNLPAGRQVRLHSCRFDSGSGYIKKRLAVMQAFFLPISSQNFHRCLVDDLSAIQPAQYNCQ
jgi:hypothetical protein